MFAGISIPRQRRRVVGLGQRRDTISNSIWICDGFGASYDT